MSKRNRKTKAKMLRELEIRSLKYLRRARWPDGVRCIRTDPATGRDCHSMNILTLTRNLPGRLPRMVFQCRKCRQQFSPSTGTIFERSHVLLVQWFRAMYFDEESVTALAEKLAVPYKTAWKMKHTIRKQEKRENRGGVQLVSVLKKGRFLGRISYAYTHLPGSR